MSIHYSKRQRGRYMRFSLMVGGDDIDPSKPYITPQLESAPLSARPYLYLYNNNIETPAEWSSSDVNVATVANYSGGYAQLRPVREGNVKVTAISDDDPSIVAILNISIQTVIVAESIEIESFELPFLVADSISIDLEAMDMTRRAVNITINNEFAE